MSDSQKQTQLKASDTIKSFLRHAHPELKRKLSEALHIILSDSHCGKTLKEELTGLRSFRLGKIRIIYSIRESGMLQIVAIGPRKSIYQETFRLIQRDSES